MSHGDERITMRLKEYVREHGTFFYFFVLFAVLAVSNSFSFGDPPRSDNLSILYFFHHLDSMPGTWLHVLNCDLWTQVRYYPLAHLILYIEFLLFGSHVFYYHIVHFAVYCSLLVLLYRLAVCFGRSKRGALFFVTLYAFLYSHSDLISWSLHTYIIAGFAFCLCGFLGYIHYLKTRGSFFLGMSALCFLLGMLCYETFVLLPAGIFFLSNIGFLHKERVVRLRNKVLSCTLVLAPVYALYAAGWAYTRSLRTYAMPLIDIRGIFLLPSLIKSFLCSLFALINNGILVNVLPFLAFPPRFNDQVFEMGGMFTLYEQNFYPVFIAGAAAGALAVAGFLWYLVRRHDRDKALVSVFILYLFLSQYTVLFATRSMTNPLVFILAQFRYQFIPNACIGLLALCALPVDWPEADTKKRVVIAVAACVLAVNAYCSIQSALSVHRGLAPLRGLISKISSAIDRGSVSETNKLYLDDSVIRYIPPICWNERMGSAFMKGTYQWIFDKQQIRVFAWRLSDAMFIVDPQTRDIVINPAFDQNQNKSDTKGAPYARE
jgi:hypothetical protein